MQGEAEADALMLREWIFEPGLPANVAKPDPAAFAAVDAAVSAYAAEGTIPAGYAQWSSAERQRFLDNIPKQRTAEQLAALNEALGLSGTGNNEELFLWLELALANRYEPAVPQAEEFPPRSGARNSCARCSRCCGTRTNGAGRSRSASMPRPAIATTR